MLPGLPFSVEGCQVVTDKKKKNMTTGFTREQNKIHLIVF